MPRVLILSSFVAASRVGGSAQALALARLGIERPELGEGEVEILELSGYTFEEKAYQLPLTEPVVTGSALTEPALPAGPGPA